MVEFDSALLLRFKSTESRDLSLSWNARLIPLSCELTEFTAE